MSERFWTTDEQIETVCSYLKCDNAVASYFGVPLERVEHVRAHMRSKPRWMFRADTVETKSTTGGHEAHLVARELAEWGSRALKDQLQAFYRKWEEKHGFQAGAGEILLPAGYVP